MKEYFLTILRDEKTTTDAFRQAADCLCHLLAAEAVQKVPLHPIQVNTPLGSSIQGSEISCRVILIPILRAGLSLLPAFQKIFPGAPVGFFGIRRDEKTAEPHLYYENLPKLGPKDWIFLLDPMLATGGSACFALQRLKELGAAPEKTSLVSIVASQEGVRVLRTHFPKTLFFSAAIDPTLNDKKFIVPGLGDFGDRYFGST